MRSLDSLGKTIKVRNRILVARERQRLIGPEPLKNMDGLFQPTHARSRTFECHPSLLVLGSEPSCPNPKLESTIRKEVKRRCFFRQHHRMPVVVIEHQASNSESPGGAGGGH